MPTPDPHARIFELLRKFHGGDHQGVIEWLNTRHRELNDRTPLEVIVSGQAGAVRDMLEAAYLGLLT